MRQRCFRDATGVGVFLAFRTIDGVRERRTARQRLSNRTSGTSGRGATAHTEKMLSRTNTTEPQYEQQSAAERPARTHGEAGRLPDSTAPADKQLNTHCHAAPQIADMVVERDMALRQDPASRLEPSARTPSSALDAKATQSRVDSDSGVRRIEVAECMTNMPRSGRTTRQRGETQGTRASWAHQGSPPHLYRRIVEKRLAEAGAHACTAQRRFFQPSHDQDRPTGKSNNRAWHAGRQNYLLTVKGKKIGKALRIEKLPCGPCAQAL